MGWETVYLGVEGEEAGANETHIIMSHGEQTTLLGFDSEHLPTGKMYGDYVSTDSYLYQIFNSRLAVALKKHADPETDLVILPFGHGHGQAIANWTGPIVEHAIGYPQEVPGTFKIFESYAWLHWHIAQRSPTVTGRGQWGKDYEWVIPHYVDALEWPEPTIDNQYLLFLGRYGDLKGLSEIIDLAKAMPDQEIRLYGQGDFTPFQQKSPSNMIYHPPLLGDDRKEVFAHATALLAPSRFVEPGHHTHIEALVSGLPVICTDFGVFTETIGPWNGRRCHYLSDYVRAVGWAHDLDLEQRTWLRESAMAKYDIITAGAKYDKIFNRILDLKSTTGWYELPKAA